MLLHTRGADLGGLHTGVVTTEIARTSRLVSRLTGYAVQPNKAIVGRNAFAHESGIHQDGVLKERTTFEIMDATTVGLEANQIVLGKHSGRHALRQALEELGFTVDGQALNTAFKRFKEIADKKKQVTAMDLEALVTDELREEMTGVRARVVRGRGVVDAPAARDGGGAAAGRRGVSGSFTGDGPVDAVFHAINAATGIDARLREFRVDAVTGGQDALGEVSVVLELEGQTAAGQGVSTDIIEASGRAYVRALSLAVAKAARGGSRRRSRSPSSPSTAGRRRRAAADAHGAYVITYACTWHRRTHDTRRARAQHRPAREGPARGRRACRCATSPSARGVSAPMLSQVERGETSPTLAVAARIAAGLDLRLSQLLRLDEGGAVTVVRAGERRKGGSARSGHTIEVLTPPLPGQRAELSRHVLAAGAKTGGHGDPPMHEPGSREIALVEAGAVVLAHRRRAPRAGGRRHGDLRRRPAPPLREPRSRRGGDPRRRQRRAAAQLTETTRRRHEQPTTLFDKIWADHEVADGPDLHRPAPRARGDEPAGVRRAAARRPPGAPAGPHDRDGRPQRADRRHAGRRARSRTSCRACRSRRSSATARSSASRSTRSAPTARASSTSSGRSSASRSRA